MEDFDNRPVGFLKGLVWVAFMTALLCIAGYFCSGRAHAHGIYTAVHGKDGFSCCSDADCAVAQWREGADAEHYEFLGKENTWIIVPVDRISFLPIAGEEVKDHRGHLCYVPYEPNDREDRTVFDTNGTPFILFCAFINPGGA